MNSQQNGLSANLLSNSLLLAAGYLCSGICISLFAGIHLWARFIDSGILLTSVTFILIFVLSAVISLLIMRYMIKRIGPKAFFEHDVLVCLIGMIFIALAINQAMLFVGLIITSASLAVFTFENIHSQIDAVRRGLKLILSGWIAGPVISVLLLIIFSDWALIVLRLIFAHYALIAFWLWIKRLDRHEEYKNIPKFLSGNGSKQ
ncbi:MAG: hypothetical protein ACI4UM_08315 [Succinivibrio sp.]